MKRLKCIVKILVCLLCGAGMVWFFLPALKRGFGLGSVIGEMICITVMLLTIFYQRIVKRGGAYKVLIRLAACFVAVGLFWCTYLTVLMNLAQDKAPPKDTNIILLGAQVYNENHMSLSLASRVDRAYAYLVENENAICIVTGGQGNDEPCTEASVEKKFLMEMGIAEDRIYLEDQSHNTRENILFARDIAEANNLGTEFAVVTQGFHMFRSMQLAESMGLETYSVVSYTDPLLYPGYYGRELLSLTKWHVQELFLAKEG